MRRNSNTIQKKMFFFFLVSFCFVKFVFCFNDFCAADYLIAMVSFPLAIISFEHELHSSTKCLQNCSDWSWFEWDLGMLAMAGMGETMARATVPSDDD